MTSQSESPRPSHYLRLAWSNLAAQSAEQLSAAAASIVAVLSLGAGVGQTGILQAVQTLPFVLFAIPVGLLADRLSRRSLMAWAEGMRAASLLAILVFMLCGWLSVPLLAIFGFVGACGTVAYSVGAPSLLPSLVPRAALQRANGWIELARTVAITAGPAAAGAIVGWFGGEPAFGFAAVLSLGAVFLLAGLHEPARPSAPARHPLRDLRDGAAFVFTHSLLMPIFITLFIFNIAFFMVYSAYVPYAISHIGMTASQVGATLGAFGAAMIVAALSVRRVMASLPFGMVIAVGPIISFFGSILLALTIVAPSFWLAALGMFFLGIGPPLWTVSTTTLRQSVTPPDMLGRAFAINIMAYAARPIGATLRTAIGAAYGAEACLIAGAVVFFLQALVSLVTPIRHLVEQPQVAG